MDNRIRKQIEEYTKSFKWTPKNFYWKHALQTRKFALFIQKKVGGDKDVVKIAALFHDIGKAKLLAPKHEMISARLAEAYLKKIKFNQEKIKKIIECIKYENFRSIEAKILRSADSMSLIMDKSGGREWFFRNVLKNSKRKILAELEKSYFEIKFEFARKFVEKTFKKLLKKYKKI